MKTTTNIDFVIDHHTGKLAPRGGVGDLAVSTMGTFVVTICKQTNKMLLMRLYEPIKE